METPLPAAAAAMTKADALRILRDARHGPACSDYERALDLALRALTAPAGVPDGITAASICDAFCIPRGNAIRIVSVEETPMNEYGQSPVTHGRWLIHLPTAAAQLSAAPPSDAPGEGKALTLQLRPLSWDDHGDESMCDKGFHVEHVPDDCEDEDGPWRLVWGEGDPDYFATLDAAKADADRQWREFVMDQVEPALPLPQTFVSRATAPDADPGPDVIGTDVSPSPAEQGAREARFSAQEHGGGWAIYDSNNPASWFFNFNRDLNETWVKALARELNKLAPLAAGRVGVADEWAEAVRIACLDDVDEALRDFAHDSTGDNGTMVVREVMRAVAGSVKGNGNG